MRIGSIAYASLAVLSLGCAAGNNDFSTPAESALTAGFHATVATNPSPVTVGSPASIDVRVQSSAGSAVNEFDLVHTQPMHFVAVGSDLEDFIHIHPTLQAAGNLTGTTTFATARPYSVFMEYTPKGSSGVTLSRAQVSPSGAVPTPAHLSETNAFAGSVTRSVTASNTAVEIVGTAGGMLMANTPAHLTVGFHEADGSPISDLTNWLGMPSHAIIVSEDLSTFLHVHGMAESGGGHGGHGGHMHGDGAGSTSKGPVGIDLTLPSAGLYKMFLQFQRGTTVITAPFVLKVMAGNGTPPPPPSCATMTCPAGKECMVMGGAAMCM